MPGTFRDNYGCRRKGGFAKDKDSERDSIAPNPSVETGGLVRDPNMLRAPHFVLCDSLRGLCVKKS